MLNALMYSEIINQIKPMVNDDVRQLLVIVHQDPLLHKLLPSRLYNR